MLKRRLTLSLRVVYGAKQTPASPGPRKLSAARLLVVPQGVAQIAQKALSEA